MKLRQILESLDKGVEDYAKRHNLGEISWAGSGDMGNAYYTERGTILKTTTDDTEIDAAKSIIGKNLSNVVKVFDVEGNIIHMEELSMDGIEDLFGDAMGYSEFGDFDDIDVDEHEDMSEETKQFILDVQHGTYELRSNGVLNLDLHDGNVGKKSDGNYAILDMSNEKGKGRIF